MSTDKPACVGRVLDGLDPRVLARMAGELRSLVDRVTGYRDGVAGVADVPEGSWRGATRTAVAGECTGVARQMTTGIARLGEAAETLSGFRARVEGHQGAMRRLCREWDDAVPGLLGRLGHDLWQDPRDIPGSVSSTWQGNDLSPAVQQQLADIARRMQLVENDVVADVTRLNSALQRCGMSDYHGAPRSGSWGDTVRGGALEKGLPLAHGYRAAQEAAWFAEQAGGLEPGRGVDDSGSALDPKAAALFGERAGDPVFASALAATPGGVVALKKVQDSQNPPAGWATGVNRWWKALPRKDKDRLAVLLVPDAGGRTGKDRLDQIDGSDVAALGGLGGIPTVIRDRANRRTLAASRPALVQYLDHLDGPADVAGLDAERYRASERSRISKILIGTDKLTTALGNTPPEAFLLAYDNQSNGHAALAYGNPDTANHTVTYVPGLTSTIAGAGGDTGRAHALQVAAMKRDRGSVASIYWLGYDAPQLAADSLLIPGNSVMSTGDAERGALPLTAFVTGLDASHDRGIPSHTTLLGHSYGSLVVGEAASHHQGLTDEIIAVGSPGMGVEHARDLGVAPGHVYAGNNRLDIVPHATQVPGIDGRGMGAALEDPSAPRSAFGPNTTSADFGAHVIPVDPDPSGGLLGPHSSYWNQPQNGFPGTSLASMADIVTGHDPGDTPVPNAH